MRADRSTLHLPYLDSGVGGELFVTHSQPPGMATFGNRRSDIATS
jgi:hypothetical protein